MTNDKSYVFGLACLAYATDTSWPAVCAVYHANREPFQRQRVVDLLGGRPTQFKLTDTHPSICLNLDALRLEINVNAKTAHLADPFDFLDERVVAVVNPYFDITDSLRLFQIRKSFDEFTWPNELVEKLESDYRFAMAEAKQNAEIELMLKNLEFDARAV